MLGGGWVSLMWAGGWVGGWVSLMWVGRWVSLMSVGEWVSLMWVGWWVGGGGGGGGAPAVVPRTVSRGVVPRGPHAGSAEGVLRLTSARVRRISSHT